MGPSDREEAMLAELDDEAQVALVEQTDNRLSAADEEIPQPPQDPAWRPDCDPS